MSPRYKKPRRCSCPFKDFKGEIFKPRGIPMSKIQIVTLYHDELETLKLCDFDGLSREEAGERMGISRGTVQRLLSSARRKVAEALVNGKAIVFGEE